jgi:hypothetical protein
MTEEEEFDEFFDLVGEEFVVGHHIELNIVRELVTSKTRKVYSIDVGGGTGSLRSYNND